VYQTRRASCEILEKLETKSRLIQLVKARAMLRASFSAFVIRDERRGRRQKSTEDWSLA